MHYIAGHFTTENIATHKYYIYLNVLLDDCIDFFVDEFLQVLAK